MRREGKGFTLIDPVICMSKQWENFEIRWSFLVLNSNILYTTTITFQYENNISLILVIALMRSKTSRLIQKLLKFLNSNPQSRSLHVVQLRIKNRILLLSELLKSITSHQKLWISKELQIIHCIVSHNLLPVSSPKLKKCRRGRRQGNHKNAQDGLLCTRKDL